MGLWCAVKVVSNTRPETAEEGSWEILLRCSCSDTSELAKPERTDQGGNSVSRLEDRSRSMRRERALKDSGSLVIQLLARLRRVMPGNTLPKVPGSREISFWLSSRHCSESILPRLCSVVTKLWSDLSGLPNAPSHRRALCSTMLKLRAR